MSSEREEHLGLGLWASPGAVGLNCFCVIFLLILNGLCK